MTDPRPGQTSGWRATWRRIWQPPARALERRSVERRVQFLELFFDLVFVALVAQLAHRLAEHPSWSGIGWFALIFFAVWTSWLNGSIYHDAHGTDDLSIRILTFTQMGTVAVMAAFVGDVPGEGAGGFAMAYGVNSAILATMWFRTGYHDPAHRQASYPYAAAYAMAALAFAASSFISEPGIYWLWGVGLAFEVLAVLPVLRRRDRQVEGALTTPSLIERFGLFVIIVLGEVVVGSVNGMADQEPVTTQVLTVGVLGIAIAVALWWVYFDLISHRPARVGRVQFVWGYLHLPLVIGIGATGAAVLATIEHVGEPLMDSVRWLLVGSVSLALFSVVAIASTLVPRPESHQIQQAAALATLFSACAIPLVGFVSFGANGTLVLVGALLFAPVALAIVVWAKSLRAEDVVSLDS
ncbi:MAG: low temperature requirement protein A [Acidimicrobiia bacterium]